MVEFTLTVTYDSDAFEAALKTSAEVYAALPAAIKQITVEAHAQPEKADVGKVAERISKAIGERIRNLS